MTSPRVRTGLDRLSADDFATLSGRRVAFLGNPTSVDAQLRHALDLLAASKQVNLVRLFGPEHGLRAEAQDMAGVDDTVDSRTGLPIVSLYGSDTASLKPTAAQLDGLDVIVIDIQDIGSRYYTYAATMGLVMEAAGAAGVSVMVLDRPNPLGGVAVEGGGVEAGFESFVGQYPVAVRHGLTLAEYARYLVAHCGVRCELEIAEMEGWSREMFFDDTGLPWVLPSPNMPTLDSAVVYPGMCLIEGTEISEGRGTTRPFELVGAPWLDAYAMAEALEGEDLPGLRVRPCSFLPTFQKWGGQICGGVQLHVEDRVALPSLLLGHAVTLHARRLGGERFSWREKPYEFVGEIPAYDLLCGSAKPRELMEAGAGLREIAASWADEEAELRERRRDVLLY